MSSLSVWAHFPTKSDMFQYSCTLAGSDDEYQKYTQLHRLNNSRFGDYLHRIYPNELEVNDTTDNHTSASYIDLHLEIDSGGRFKTKLYDKRDDFTFPIVNFPFISNNIPASLYLEFTFHNSYVILELVPSTLIFWTEISFWRKSYSSKTTFLLNWSHRYKYSTVVITIWLTVTKYPYLKWRVDFFFPYYYEDFDRTWLHIWVTRWVSYKKQELVTLRVHRNLPPLFLVGSVLLILLVFCVVLLCAFTFLVPSCDVGYDFRMETLFGSSLSAVVCHVLFTLFVFAYVSCCICLSSS